MHLWYYTIRFTIIICDADCRKQASKRAQQCTVAADVHLSPDADSDVTDDVTSSGSCQPPSRYCSATVGSFRRRDRLRSSLPVVSAMNKSMERPLGSYGRPICMCDTQLAVLETALKLLDEYRYQKKEHGLKYKAHSQRSQCTRS